MKKKQKEETENFLDKKPIKRDGLEWSVDEAGAVTLKLENTGIVNRIAQKLIRKPRFSYIHLDEMGNFIWPEVDGETTITEIGVKVKKHFGEKAEPLYERLAQYFKILESHGFVELN